MLLAAVAAATTAFIFFYIYLCIYLLILSVHLFACFFSSVRRVEAQLAVVAVDADTCIGSGASPGGAHAAPHCLASRTSKSVSNIECVGEVTCR